jgi:asparagine synthetase B (glutamine-hydrolysing)
LEVKENLPAIQLNALARSAAIDRYIELFRASIRKRIVKDAPIRLPLSGGRDSRHILLELVAAGATPECCYTSSFSNMENDVLVAQQLCSAFGVRHAQSHIPGDLVAAEREKNVIISFQALDHAWLCALAQTIANPAAVSYDGIAGDVLSAGHFHSDENSSLYRAGRFEDLARILAPERNSKLVPSRWSDAIAAADPYPSLIRELVRHQHTQNPMMFFYLYNRSRRAVSVTIEGLFGPAMGAVFAPFLDRDVFDFLAGLPESMFVDRMFHTEAIAKAFPAIEHIGYSKKTPLPHSLYHRYGRQGLHFAIRAHPSPLLDRQAAILRFARSIVSPRHASDARWLLHESVMLYQLGRLMEHYQP